MTIVDEDGKLPINKIITFNAATTKAGSAATASPPAAQAAAGSQSQTAPTYQVNTVLETQVKSLISQPRRETRDHRRPGGLDRPR